MEYELYHIVRFVYCLAVVIATSVIMIKADDNNAFRRTVGLFGCVGIYFNEWIGLQVYRFIAALMEAISTAMGLVFVITLMIAIVLLPLALIVRMVVH